MNVTNSPACKFLPDDTYGGYYTEAAVYLSFLIGVPLNCLIIYRLCLPRTMKPYHYFLMSQSVVDTALVVDRLLIVLHSTNCFQLVTVIPYHLLTVGNTLLMNFQLLQSALLMTYWKHAVRPEMWLDRSLYTAIISSIFLITAFFTWDFSLEFHDSSIIAAIYKFFYQYTLEINLILYAPLCISCCLTFLSIHRLKRSKMSEVTIQGTKRVAKSLFLQAIAILTRGLLSVAEGFIMTTIKNMESIKAAVILLIVAPQGADKWPLEQKDSLSAAYVIVDAIFQVLVVPARGFLMWWAIRALLRRKVVPELKSVKRGSTHTIASRIS